jgi:outer membrane murein-binding lipoprotein Lpp
MVSILGVLVLAGCATTDERLRAMQSENADLKQDVQGKANQIQDLSADKAKLTIELDYYTKRGEVLAKEKIARQDEEARLRRGIRAFTELMQASLQTYFQRTEIIDYLGSELIARASDDPQKNVLLVDLHNPIRERGTIIGGRAWLTGPTRLSYCLLRQDKAGDKYRVVSITPEIAVAQTGMQNWVFDIPLAARKGDLIGVYVADTVTIPYDDVDTGEVVAFSGAVKANSSVTIISGNSRHKRTYSFGVVGYFDSFVANSEVTTPVDDLTTSGCGK